MKTITLIFSMILTINTSAFSLNSHREVYDLNHECNFIGRSFNKRWDPENWALGIFDIKEQFEKAEKGNPVSQLILAAMFTHGIKAPKNIAEGRKWFNLSLIQGFGDIKELSEDNSWADGDGKQLLCFILQQNKKEAFYWFRKAAMMGNSYYQYIMGEFYEGELWDKSDDKGNSKFWYAMAANGGNERAQIKIGGFYWHQKLAMKGRKASQEALSWMYSSGKGVEKNNYKAYVWHLVAGKKSNYLERVLNTNELENAQIEATKLWKEIKFSKE